MHAIKNSLRNFVGLFGILASKYPKLDPMFVREEVTSVDPKFPEYAYLRAILIFISFSLN